MGLLSADGRITTNVTPNYNGCVGAVISKKAGALGVGEKLIEKRLLKRKKEVINQNGS
jgi:hypothetical protein